jgi:hypothetical protein
MLLATGRPAGRQDDDGRSLVVAAVAALVAVQSILMNTVAHELKFRTLIKLKLGIIIHGYSHNTDYRVDSKHEIF